MVRPGGDLLSRALRRSTIGAEGFHGRVRNGIGCIAPRCGHQTKAKIRIVGFVSVSTSCWRVSVQSGFSANLLARALPGGCRHWSAGYIPPDIYRRIFTAVRADGRVPLTRNFPLVIADRQACRHVPVVIPLLLRARVFQGECQADRAISTG